MSRSVSNTKTTRVQKLCTLWTHDDNFSRDDIVFNGDKFPEIPTPPGTLLQIVTIDTGTAVRDFQATAKNVQVEAAHIKHETVAPSSSGTGRRGSFTVTIDENGSKVPGGRAIDAEKAYVFAVTPLSADLKSKHANLQVGCASADCDHKLTYTKGIYLGENR